MQTKREKISFKNKILVVIILCSLGIAIYSNTFYSAFHFDDESSIVKNLSIKNLSNLRAIWNFWPTRFITYLSLAFNYHLHKLGVFGYHFFNLGMHLCTAILVWWFTILTFSTPAMRDNKISKHAHLIAFFVGALFVVHPIQTEAVTYIIQRATIIATFFYLLSLSLYIKSRNSRIEKGNPVIARFYYSSSIITAVVAMFTKEMIITLPLALLLYEFCFFKIQGRHNFRKVLPFFIISLIVPLTMFATNSVDFTEMRRVSEYSPNISPWNYLLTQFRVIITYLRLLFLPLKQNLDYDYPIAQTFMEPIILLSFLFLTIILVIAKRIFFRYRLVSFAIFWVFVTLLPESSIIPIQDVIFEHRLYLPMAGYSIFLVSVAYYLFANRNIGITVAILILIIHGYAILTYRRNFVWQDNLILAKDIVSKSPRKARSYVQLGNAYSQKRMYDQAILSFISASKIAPSYSDAYYNLGAVYYEKNNFDQSVFYFNKAIQIDPQDFEAYYYRGMSFRSRNEYAKAISDFSNVLRINSRYVEAYRMLAEAYSHEGRNDEAIALYKKAILANPDIAELYVYFAIFYGNMGNHEAAIGLCKKAIKIKPNLADAYINLGNAYGNIGNFREAITSFQKAVHIDPNLALLHANLSTAYYYTEQYGLAIQHCDKAGELGYQFSPGFLESLKKYRK